MRLFWIIDNNHPHAAGGGYYALFKFAEHMAARGHENLIHAVNDMRWVARGPGLRLHHRPSIPRRGRILAKLDRMLSDACDEILLSRRIAAFRPDWTIGVLKESAIKAVRLGRRHGTRVANFIYECPLWLEELVGRERFEREADAPTRLLWERTRQAYLESDVLLPNSELSRSYNERWLEGRAVAPPAYPGIDPASMPLGEPARRERDAPAEILSVGRLVGSKNVDHLIEAAKLLRRPVHLHICGGGPERGRLEAMASGVSATFHGYVDDARLWELFRRSDLVAYPTAFEGFGMPPMQSLYFGKPCVASDLPILRSVYGDLLDYFPLGDIPSLAETIEGLLADPELRRRRGEEGRAYVLSRFTWDAAARSIEETLAGHGAAAGASNRARA